MANYPTSLDDGTSLPDPTAVSKTNSPSHSALHAAENAAVKALEAKLGTGASTPVVNRLMYGTGTGTSAWTALTSAQLLATLSDETGTGSAVFATTPTLVTPKVDTINENTPGNGTTIGGVNIKSGALVTSNSVVTANITDANVTNSKVNNTGTFNSSYVWSTWSPSFTGFSANPTPVVARYTQFGKSCTVSISALGGTSNAVGLTFTLPLAAATVTNNTIDVWARAQDNGTLAATPGLIEFTSGLTIATVYKDHSGAAWTSSGTKGFRASFTYEVA